MIIRNLLLIGLFTLYSITAFSQLFINEIMASNNSSLADEFGEYDDWIEIYNSGNQAIDLAGYYFSDDLSSPLKWQIPSDNPDQTTIPAEGFLILWADNNPEQGAHHMDFKLSAAGEALIVTLPDGNTTVDQITFGIQTADISYGRSTDGAMDFQLFSHSTPGFSNNGSSGSLTYPVTFCIQVANDQEDAVENINGEVSISGFGLQIGEDFNGEANTTGIRFPLSLPQGAIIENATIKFKAAGPNDSSPANWTIKAHKIIDAPPFENFPYNISERENTDAEVSWSPEAWSTDGSSGLEEENSPNLAEIIQEITDQNDWQTDNEIVFIITGTGMRNAFGGSASGTNFGPELCIEAGIPFPTEPVTNIFINEIAASGTSYLDDQGDREDWIELYNANEYEVDLSGFYLTDDFDDPDQSKIPDGVIIPANGYLTFIADGNTQDGDLHTNFSLSGEGEAVALSMQLDDGLATIDAIEFDEIPFMASFGRQTDGSENWILFGAPTPEASNDGANRYLTPPIFTIESGIYQGTQELTAIIHTLQDVSIYYTTDSSIPDNSDLLYTTPIPILGSQNIRAIAYKSGYEASQVANAAYLINVESNIPIVYLTTEYDNFFDPEIGIYVTGTNGIPLCGADSANYNQNWERPVNVKMFLPDGTTAFDVNAGVEISGVCSRNNAMKSLAFSLKGKEYGDSELGYQLFDNREKSNYKRWKLRNSGQDYNRMGYRDMVNQALLDGVVKDLEYQLGRPVNVYLNGQYWGIHNIREKYTKDFFEDNFDADPEKIDIIKSPGLPWVEVKQGSLDQFNSLFDFVDNNSLTDENNYQFVEELVDINAFHNYWIAMTYLANMDWPANNLTIWKEQEPGKKWRYAIADTDGSTHNFLSTSSEPEYNTFETIMVPDSEVWPNHSNSTLFLRKLVEREDFRNEFVQRSCSFIGLVYSEQRAHHFADSIKALYDPNIVAHLSKWGNQGAMGALGLDMAADIAVWEGWIDNYKSFFIDRPDYFRTHLKNHFELDSTYQLAFVFDESTRGRVVVNSSEMEMPFNFSNLYFRNIPLRVKAIAKPGAVFSHWLETGITDPEIDFISDVNTSLTPVFTCALAPGTPCDDEDTCTENDVIGEDCACSGVIPDNNGDGEMNELDCNFVNVSSPESQKSLLKIFPNPAQDFLNIQLEFTTIKLLEIYNSAGIVVFHQYNLAESNYTLETSQFTRGIYFINVQDNDGNYYFEKFVVLRE